MDTSEYNLIISKCKECRKDILNLTFNLGSVGAHIGGGLSLVEIMVMLYCKHLFINKVNPIDEERDRMIFSKGHGTLALYTAMKQANLITNEELYMYKKNESIFSAHPSMNSQKYIEFSSGSLGQGLSLGVGVAIGLKRKENYRSKVYVVLGDGECNEGQVWEAAESASHFKLDNLIVIIDNNKLQYDGYTDDIMKNSNFIDKWKSFGFDVMDINGHNISEIDTALCNAKNAKEKPILINANTIKGKGISFMENNVLWHNHSLTKEQYEQGLKEI